MDQIDLLTEILVDNYDTVSAFNGKQAIEIASKSPQPDLILLDIIIPAPDGYQVCSILQSDKRTAHIPIILTTGLSGNNKSQDDLPPGVVGYINKPYNIRHLTTEIQNCINL